MTHRLAICLPVAPTQAGYEMVRRAVMALRAQDCDPSLFEVVVAVDGMHPAEFFGHDAFLSQPFALRVVTSPRTPGLTDIPHRNHARNAAWKASTAPLCWMLDADFILPPHAVRHVLAEHDAAISRGAPAVLSPCLWQFGGASTEQWWERSSAWAASGDPGEFRALLACWPEWDRGVFSGFGEDAAAPPHINGEPVSVSVGARMIEGMPVLWRGLLEALGGFDQAYVGWGGDKISLIDVLHGLAAEGVIDIRLLSSVVAVHQPHATDATHTDRRSKANEKRRMNARMAIQSRTLEWKRRIPGIVDALRAAWGANVQAASFTSDLLPLVEMLAAQVLRRWKPGAQAAAFGSFSGILRAQLERVGIRDVAAGETLPTTRGAVVVAIDPLGVIGDGGWHAALANLGARLRSLSPTATVVIAQRLDGPGLSGLRPLDIQTAALRNTRDARVVKHGGVRYAYLTGNI